MNDKVEYIELVCDADIREIEILVKVPYNGELTDCYASGIYDDNGLREMKVTTFDDYTDVYVESSCSPIHREIDLEYVGQIEELLNEQL